MQCVAPSHIESSNFADFWTNQEQTNPDALQNRKLRVIYHVASPEDLPSLKEKAAARGPVAAAAGAVGGAVAGGATHTPDASERSYETTKPIDDNTHPSSVQDKASSSLPPAYEPSSLRNTVDSEAAPSFSEEDHSIHADTNANTSRYVSEEPSNISSTLNHRGNTSGSSLPAATNDMLSNKSSSASTSTAPVAKNATAAANTLKKNITGSNDIPLVQALILAFITFLIGWYFF